MTQQEINKQILLSKVVADYYKPKLGLDKFMQMTEAEEIEALNLLETKIISKNIYDVNFTYIIVAKKEDNKFLVGIIHRDDIDDFDYITKIEDSQNIINQLS